MPRAQIIEVIEVKSQRGNGKEYPYREVTQYFNRDGELLAERDPFADDPIEIADKGRLTHGKAALDNAGDDRTRRASNLPMQWLGPQVERD